MAPVFTAIAGRENPGPAAAARGTGQAGIKIFKYWSLLISSMGQYRLGCLESGHFSVVSEEGSSGHMIGNIHNPQYSQWCLMKNYSDISYFVRAAEEGLVRPRMGTHDQCDSSLPSSPLLGSAQVRERPPLVSWSKIYFTVSSCSLLTVPANFCRK